MKVNTRGTGSEQYPPHMLLGLLIYSYATGTFGSRRIEQSTYDSVPVRLLTADTHPDHDTICAFRRNNLEAIAVSFVDVLELARELKLLQLGTVSLDGTHIRASASKDKNVTYQRAQALRTQLRADVDELLQQAFGQPDEAAIMRRLRETPDLILALAAESHGELIGHVAFSRAMVFSCAS